MSRRDGSETRDGDGDEGRSGDDAISGHPIFAAVYDRLGGGEKFLREHRAYLARDLRDRESVLDLGAGTGGMFPLFASAVRENPALTVHGIEPDPHMKRRAERAASEEELDIDLRLTRAESLPYSDDSFDVVIASLVFCTIADPDRALDEVRRVLRPDGELRFLEHVRAEGRLGRMQDLLAPAWKVLGAGCHLNRDFRSVVVRSSIETIEIERISGPPPATPMLRGTAVARH